MAFLIRLRLAILIRLVLAFLTRLYEGADKILDLI